MSYAQVADMVARFGQREMIQLTDQSNPPADQVDATVAQAALDGASSIMDGSIAVKYALPLPAPTSPILVEVCCDIARHRLYRDQIPDAVAAREKSARDTLLRIAQGLVKIDAPGTAVEPLPRPDVVIFESDPRRTRACELDRF
jgi:phage gp36-like protein